MLATEGTAPMCAAISSEEYSRSGFVRSSSTMRSLVLPCANANRADAVETCFGVATLRPRRVGFWGIRLADAPGAALLMWAGYHSGSPHPSLKRKTSPAVLRRFSELVTLFSNLLEVDSTPP